MLLKDVEYPTNNITFEDGSYITTFDSYRGSYSELAIASSAEATTDIETVKSFVGRLENMIGETIHGYKGGDYTVTNETTVHKANYGECDATKEFCLVIRDLDLYELRKQLKTIVKEHHKEKTLANKTKIKRS